jgi:peptidoglycan/xylan/chitin deacetylase (PgdA/CDA1 family)
VLFKLVFPCLSLLVVFFFIAQIYGESEIKYSDNKFNSKLNLLVSSINNNSSFPQQNTSNSIGKDVNSDLEKAVIIMFDRGYNTQFTNAKPILDKYGFKASFFVICSFID